MQLPIRPICSD